MIGGYQILDPLGEGSFGKTYKATRMQDQATFVVKIPPRNDYIFLLKGGFRSRVNVEHPQIIGFAEADVDPASGTPYAAFPYVSKRSLSSIMRKKGSLDVKTSVLTIRVVLNILNHIATKNVAHGCLTPTNVIFGKRGKATFTDFGLCELTRSIDQNSFLQHMYRSPAPGLPEVYRFLSPARRQGAGASPQHDLYSVGILLYYLLSGEAEVNPSYGEKLHAKVPIEVARLILGLTADSPEYATPAEALQALSALDPSRVTMPDVAGAATLTGRHAAVAPAAPPSSPAVPAAPPPAAPPAAAGAWPEPPNIGSQWGNEGWQGDQGTGSAPAMPPAPEPVPESAPWSQEASPQPPEGEGWPASPPAWGQADEQQDDAPAAESNGEFTPYQDWSSAGPPSWGNIEGESPGPPPAPPASDAPSWGDAPAAPPASEGEAPAMAGWGDEAVPGWGETSPGGDVTGWGTPADGGGWGTTPPAPGEDDAPPWGAPPPAGDVAGEAPAWGAGDTAGEAPAWGAGDTAGEAPAWGAGDTAGEAPAWGAPPPAGDTAGEAPAWGAPPAPDGDDAPPWGAAPDSGSEWAPPPPPGGDAGAGDWGAPPPSGQDDWGAPPPPPGAGADAPPWGDAPAEPPPGDWGAPAPWEAGGAGAPAWESEGPGGTAPLPTQDWGDAPAPPPGGDAWGASPPSGGDDGWGGSAPWGESPPGAAPPAPPDWGADAGAAPPPPPGDWGGDWKPPDSSGESEQPPPPPWGDNPPDWGSEGGMPAPPPLWGEDSGGGPSASPTSGKQAAALPQVSMDESGELSPGEIVFRRDASSAPDPMSSPFGDVSLFTEEMAEPAPLDPAEALALMRRSRAPEKGYGLVVSGVDAAAKRDVAAGIIARLLGISQPQALEMCKQAVIPVLDRVEKSRAEEARLLFEAENIPAKVTAGNS